MDRVRERLIDTPEDDPTLTHLKRIGTALGIECKAPDTEAEIQSEAGEETGE